MTQKQLMARTWLAGYLSSKGPSSRRGVLAAGMGAGHTPNLITQAAAALRVLSERSSTGFSTWRLPPSPNAG